MKRPNIQQRWPQSAANPYVARYKAFIPKQGLSRNDGDALTLGAQTMQFYLTSAIRRERSPTPSRVLDNGRPRTVEFWGGIGLRNNLSEVQSYVSSHDRFRTIAKASDAEVGISNHPHADMTLEWVSRLESYPRPTTL